jgi:hypothetical protein
MCFLSASLAIGTSIATAVGLTVTESTAIAIGATTIGLAAVGTATAGTLSTIQAVQQADAQADAAKHQAEVEQQNARMSARRAERIGMEADQKRAALLREHQQALGTGRAGYAASGVVLGSGVTLDYEADVADMLDLDMRNLNYDVESQQWQHRVEAVNHRNQAAMYKAQEQGYKQKKTSALVGGIVSTVASTASTVGSMIMPFAGKDALSSGWSFGWIPDNFFEPLDPDLSFGTIPKF